MQPEPITESLSGRLWQIEQVNEDKARRIVERFGFSKTLSRLLALRDVEENDLARFLNPKLRDELPDPSTLADMDSAVRLVLQAMAENKEIAIYGDYDVDGITSVALLKSYFDKMNVPNRTYLPDRMLDGYGLSPDRLKEIESDGISFVVTLDCGAKDIEALTYAKEKNMQVVILDHHPTDEVPPAAAFVNPNSPEDKSGLGYLTAGGVAFMFLVSLNRALKSREETAELPNLMNFLELVALSTVCDVAPLTGLNRAFVARGLDALAHTNNLGLKALAKTAGMRGKPNVESFSFSLGPRINAAGRIGKADLALELLTSTDASEAEALAAQLNSLNRQRQTMEKKMLSEALARLQAQSENKEVVLVASEGWHVGIIGIIAARLKDKYQKTAVVIALNGEAGTGSIRSDGRLDLGGLIYEAVAEGLLVRGGGHKQAAGFTIAKDKVAPFTDFFVEASERQKRNTLPSSSIDAVLDFSAATRALYEELQKAAPYGKGNPTPCLLFTDGRLEHARVSGNGHLRCRFRPSSGGQAVEVVGFHQATTPLGMKLLSGAGELFHIAGSLRPAWSNMVSGVEIALADALLPNALNGGGEERSKVL